MKFIPNFLALFSKNQASKTTLSNEQKIRNANEYAVQSNKYYDQYWNDRHSTMVGFWGLYSSVLNIVKETRLELMDEAQSMLNEEPENAKAQAALKKLADIGVQLNGFDYENQLSPIMPALRKPLSSPLPSFFVLNPKLIWFNPKRIHSSINIKPVAYEGYTLELPPDELPTKFTDEQVEIARSRTYNALRYYMNSYNRTNFKGEQFVEAFISCAAELKQIEGELLNIAHDLKVLTAWQFQHNNRYISEALLITLKELKKFIVSTDFNGKKCEPYLHYFSSECSFIGVGTRGYKALNPEIEEGANYGNFPKFEVPIRRGCSYAPPVDQSALVTLPSSVPRQLTEPVYYNVSGKYLEFFNIAYNIQDGQTLTPRPIEHIYEELKSAIKLFIEINPKFVFAEFGTAIAPYEIGVQLVNGTINVVRWGYGNVDWIKIEQCK